MILLTKMILSTKQRNKIKTVRTKCSQLVLKTEHLTFYTALYTGYYSLIGLNLNDE